MNPTANLSVYAIARSMRDDYAAWQKPYLDALAQLGGRIQPDMIWNPRRGVHGEYVLAGEYDEIPRRFLDIQKNKTMFRGERWNGNCDEFADMLRAAGHDVTEDDAREFLRTYHKPTLADFIDDAQDQLDGYEEPTNARVAAVEDIFSRIGFRRDGFVSCGHRRYVRDDSAVIITAGPVTVAITARYLPKAKRLTKDGCWVLFSTRDLHDIEVAIASALVNETIAA